MSGQFEQGAETIRRKSDPDLEALSSSNRVSQNSPLQLVLVAFLGQNIKRYKCHLLRPERFRMVLIYIRYPLCANGCANYEVQPVLIVTEREYQSLPLKYTPGS